MIQVHIYRKRRFLVVEPVANSPLSTLFIGNIAATAIALMVYADRRELLTPAIVKWLQSQRAHHGGWMSTFVSFFSLNQS